MDSTPFSKYFQRIFILLLCFPFISFGHTSYFDLEEAQVTALMDEVDAEVKERLLSLGQNLLEHRYDDAVRSIIKRYLRYPRYAGKLVGRTSIYFPLFEEKLAAAGLPEALKFLPIVESSLRSQAVSPVGALGLWQFMPETAKEYGLIIDEFMDERADPVRATEAAILYLQDAYAQFEDWSLTLASYNAGKGGVRRAQRRSGGKSTFWGVKRHLPRETRNYIPGFIAATYLATFYTQHEIAVTLPSFDRQLTEAILVKMPLSFYQISQITGLPIATISQMNPSYKMGYLPAYEKGHYLTLPKRVLPAIKTYLATFGHLKEETFLPWCSVFELPQQYEETEDDYQKYIYPVFTGDSLSGIAQQMNVSLTQLALWNNLSPTDSLQQKEIIIFRPNKMVNLPTRNAHRFLAHLPIKTSFVNSNHSDSPTLLPITTRSHFWYQTNTRERPSSIISHFPDLSLEQFLADNTLAQDRPLPAGTSLKIARTN